MTCVPMARAVTELALPDGERYHPLRTAPDPGGATSHYAVRRRPGGMTGQ